MEEAAGKVICPESALVVAEDDHRLADLGPMGVGQKLLECFDELGEQ